MTKQIAKTVKKSEKTTSKKTIAARTTKKTIAEVGQEAMQIIEAHEKGADMDAGFDAGEFSGPAHSRAQEKELEALAVRNGFTNIQLDAELSRLEHEHDDDDQAPTAIITRTVDPDIKAAPNLKYTTVAQMQAAKEDPDSAYDLYAEGKISEALYEAVCKRGVLKFAKDYSKTDASRYSARPAAMIALAAKAAQKKPVAAVPVDEAGASLIAAGFTFAKAEAIEGRLASGYTHTDGRAVLVMDDGAWVLQHAVGVRLNGTDLATLNTALAAKPPKPLSAKKQRIADARARGEAGAVELKEKGAAAALSTATPVRALAVVLEAEALAAERRATKIAAATPGAPPNVIRAVEMLEATTGGSFNLNSLRGDKHYGVRMALLKKLFDRERVLVAETGINNLIQAFYSAVGVGEGCHAAQAVDFADRCKDFLIKYRAVKLAAGKEARKASRFARRSVATQLAVPGKVLPSPKPLSKKKQAATDAADRKALLVAAVATGDRPAQPNPDLKALTYVAAKNLRLLQHKNGIISLKLERCNSQGALHIWSTDAPTTTGARMVSAVLTPVLAAEVKQLPYDLDAVSLMVNAWLEPTVKKTLETETTLKNVQRAIHRVTKPVTLAAVTLPVSAPRAEAAEPRINAGSVRLLEDPALGIVLMQLEKENSQGAICVYNNGVRVGIGVVPPEILKTLRPIPGEVDLMRAANQLLNPMVPSVPVTPVAASHLTAVIHCKELINMATNATVVSSGRKFAAPAATTKTTKPAKAEKPVKAAKAPKAAKAERAPRVTEDRKIKALVKFKDLGLREGTFCYAQVQAALSSKTVSEAQAKLDTDKANPTPGRKLEVSWQVKKGYISVA